MKYQNIAPFQKADYFCLLSILTLYSLDLLLHHGIILNMKYNTFYSRYTVRLVMAKLFLFKSRISMNQCNMWQSEYSTNICKIKLSHVVSYCAFWITVGRLYLYSLMFSMRLCNMPRLSVFINLILDTMHFKF